MSNGFFKVPKAVNEPVRAYAPGTQEHKDLIATYNKMFNEKVDVPIYIGSEEIRTGNTTDIHPPHDHKHTVGKYHKAEKEHIELAVEKAAEARVK